MMATVVASAAKRMKVGPTAIGVSTDTREIIGVATDATFVS